MTQTQRKTVSFDEALEKSLELVTQKPTKEWISIFEALGRVVSKEIVCQKNLPSYDNAAMDGFAIAHKECGQTLRIKKTILAGDVCMPCLEKNECYKIMTGAKIPEDADTIVAFEEVQTYDETNAVIPSTISKGNAFRSKGEEQTVGNILIRCGEKITSVIIALLASQGITHIEVYTKIRIAIFSTGNELKKPWEYANENEIYDVNALSLMALFKEHGFEAQYGGVIPDTLSDAKAFFAKMQSYDILVTSGGVSMGEADFVEKALLESGLHSAFHGINIKPGKPTMMGKMGHCIVASLPGNPLAAYINAFIVLLPVLKKMQGDTAMHCSWVYALNAETFDVKSKRVNLVLGKHNDGHFHVFNGNRYGSGMIRPLIESNAVLISHEETQCLEKGTLVKIIPFKADFIEIKALFKN